MTYDFTLYRVTFLENITKKKKGGGGVGIGYVRNREKRHDGNQVLKDQRCVYTSMSKPLAQILSIWKEG